MTLSRNYSVFNDKLLPIEVARIYMQQAVPETSIAANLTFHYRVPSTGKAGSMNDTDSKNPHPELEKAVGQLLQRAAQLQIHHSFSFYFTLSMLEKLIKTKEFEEIELHMTIYDSYPPTLVIE
ncbi:MAG TPA: hypothetical protein VJ967_08030 [Clostridia bacterium]|nr:hypothetical protein [Clostridia bacterium]